MDRFCLRISCRLHFLTPEALGPTIDQSPAQSIRTGIEEVMGLNPVIALNFFQAKKCNCFNCFHTARIISFISAYTFVKSTYTLDEVRPLSGHRFATLRYLSRRKQLEITNDRNDI